MKKKHRIVCTFDNPNTANTFEALLKRIVLEKLAASQNCMPSGPKGATDP